MEITINGKTENINFTTIKEIVESKKLDKSGLVIEHNGTIIKKKNWSEYELQDGDKLELLSFVGGG